jgi:hypothetical protein
LERERKDMIENLISGGCYDSPIMIAKKRGKKKSRKRTKIPQT